jgi:hypothetical protein
LIGRAIQFIFGFWQSYNFFSKKSSVGRELGEEGKGGEGVDAGAEAGDYAAANGRDCRVVSHLFASKDVADVYLNDGV